MKLIRFIAILLLLTASLGQLNRLPFGDADSVVLYANDLLVGLMAILYLGYVLVIRRSWKIPPAMAGMWVFMLVGSLGLLLGSEVLSRTELLVSLSYLVRYFCYSILFFVAYDSLVYETGPGQAGRQLNRWLGWLLAAMVLMAIGGFLQLIFLPNLQALAAYGWDPHVNRLVTAMLDPNFAGCYLSIGVAVTTALLLYRRRAKIQAVLVVVDVVLVLAILLTFSRSGYLMLAGCLAIIALLKSRWLLVVGFVVALVAFLAVPRIQQRVVGALEVDTTASIRIISWQNTVNIAEHNQPFGVGYNSYRYAQDRYGILNLDTSGNAGAGSDSSWLLILATTGIIGLAVYLWSYAAILWGSLKAVLVQRDLLGPASQATALACLAVFVALIPASQFNNALFYTWILEILWPLAGLTLAIFQLAPSGRLKDV